VQELPEQVEELSGEVEELPEELTFIQKVRQFFKDTVHFVFIKVLLVDVIITLVVAASFIFKSPFSAVALSERMFWAGMVVSLTGVVVFFASSFSGRSFGVPLLIRKPEEARKFMEKTPAIREVAEKRYNVGARIWFIGMGCVAISALVERLFS
jgi:hypothetical protein